MSKIKITIGIPVYNEENNIKNLLYSIKKSNESSSIREIIIVNDGSTDNTLKIIKSIVKNIRIKVNIINLIQNQGKANAINIITRKAKTKFLFLIDSDVILYKNTIKNLLLTIRTAKDPDLICGWVDIIIKENNLLNRTYRFSSNLLKTINNYTESFYSSIGKLMCLNTKFFKYMKLPVDLVREDAYIYLYLKKHKGKFIFNDKISAIEKINEKSFRKFLIRQNRSRTKPKKHLKDFGKTGYIELSEPKINVIIKSFIVCLRNNFLDGVCWILMKFISFLFRLFYGKNLVSKSWRKIEI